MLLFSYRNELESRYWKWIEENSRPDATIKDCPVNVINFLYCHGFLNEEKILDCLRKKEIEQIKENIADENINHNA